MNKEEFNKLSKEEQMRLSSEFRKTVHKGEIVFINDNNAKSLTEEEAEEQILKTRDELLNLLNGATSNDNSNEETNNNYLKKSM